MNSDAPTVKARVALWWLSFTDRWDRLLPDEIASDPDRHRRGRLLVRFGFLGAVFGFTYASFYVVAHHFLGALVIAICSSIFAILPLHLKRRRNLRVMANFFSATLIAGFTTLSTIEGGMNGHAVAWLAGVPLCALLLACGRDAIVWAVISFLVTFFFGVCHYLEIEFPVTYPAKWINAVDAAGYAGLVPFMILLGYVFESTRRTAFTKLQNTLDELSDVNAELSKLNADKSEFLNIAAHDLKNPLSVISGYADLMHQLDGFSDEEIQKHSGEILTSANRMLDIITNLLDVQAIEEGKLNLKSEPVEIEAILSQLVRDYTNATEKKSIEVRETVGADLGRVKGDRSAVHQILDNIYSNAIKYSPPGSRVVLKAKALEGACRIEVADEGPGLSEEDQSKLFKKFSRLTPRPTGGESSNGLGLWIVNRMAETMGGKVYCVSELGKGSTFGLLLPRWDDSNDVNDTISRQDTRSLFPKGENSDGLILPG